MQEFQQRKKIRRIIYSPYILVLLAIIFVVLLRGVWGVYQKEKLSANNLEIERNELAKLEDRQKSLAASFEYLKTDDDIEKEIRTKFRAVREGEKVAVIVDEKTPTSTGVSTSTRGFWYKLFHWF